MIFKFDEFITESLDNLFLHDKEYIEDLFLAFNEDGYKVTMVPSMFTENGYRTTIYPSMGISTFKKGYKIGWSIIMIKPLKLNNKFKNNTDIDFATFKPISDQIDIINKLTKKLNYLGYDVEKSYTLNTTTISFTVDLIQKENKEISGEINLEMLADWLGQKFFNNPIGKSYVPKQDYSQPQQYTNDAFTIVDDKINVRMSTNWFNSHRNINLDSIKSSFNTAFNNVNASLRRSKRFKDYIAVNLSMDVNLAKDNAPEKYKFVIRKRTEIETPKKRVASKKGAAKKVVKKATRRPNWYRGYNPGA
jgi:hypothetical protein